MNKTISIHNKENPMQDKVITSTEAGEIAVYHVTSSPWTLRISTFRMSPGYAKKMKIKRPFYDVKLDVFDSASLEWKQLLRADDFGQKNSKKWIEEDAVVENVMLQARKIFKGLI